MAARPMRPRYVSDFFAYSDRAIDFLHEFVDRDLINGMIDKAHHSGEIDLLSIDIDGNDYWVWEVISMCSPA